MDDDDDDGRAALAARPLLPPNGTLGRLPELLDDEDEDEDEPEEILGCCDASLLAAAVGLVAPIGSDGMLEVGSGAATDGSDCSSLVDVEDDDAGATMEEDTADCSVVDDDDDDAVLVWPVTLWWLELPLT